MKIAFLTKDLDNAINIVDKHILSELKRLEGLTVHNYIFPYSLQENKIKYIWMMCFLLLRAIPKLIQINREYDVIHYSSETNYFWIFNPFLKKVFNKKTVVTIHHLNNIDKPGLKNRFLGYILRSFDMCIPISDFSRGQLISLKVSQEKITVIRNGIDKSYYSELIPGFKNYKYILFVGDEYPRKNLGLALAAFKKVVKQFPNLKFIKIGKASSSEHKAMTDKIIKELGIEDHTVLIREFVYIDELRKYYSNAEILLSPSTIEGFGLPVMEACRCKCIPLISNIDAYKEFNLPEELYVENREGHDTLQDVDLWAEKMLSIIGSSGIKKDKLRDVIYGTSLCYDWTKSAQGLKAVYNRLMSN
ncbi:MAG: glycosyltransferase [Candidatus Taylorbacteria bacterium]